MIEPPPLRFIVGTTAFIPRKQPPWLTRQISSASSRDILSTWPNRRMPALLTSTLTGPQRSLVSCTSAVQEASSLTSWWRKAADSPSSSASAAPSSLATSAITTFAPSATKARTIASPCPPAPPVTMATLSVSRPASGLCVPFVLREVSR